MLSTHKIQGVTSEEEGLRGLAAGQCVSCSPVLAQSVERLGIVVLAQLGLELRGAAWWLGNSRKLSIVFYAVGELDRPTECIGCESRGYRYGETHQLALYWRPLSVHSR